VSKDERFLRDMAREFEEGFNSRDVERIMRFYGETYVDVNLRNPVQTKAERREYYTRVMQRPGIRLNVQPEDILIRGNLAFVRGTVLVTRTVPDRNDVERNELRYLEIAERTPNGSWQVIWGMDGPIQDYTPGG
jgi:ketosteroid isomerase-like protein